MESLDEFYAKEARKAAQAKYRPKQLIHELGHFFEARLADLSARSLIALASPSVRLRGMSTSGGDGFTNPCIVVESKGAAAPDGSLIKLREEARVEVDFGWEFFGLAHLVRKFAFERLGRDEFCERQWRALAKKVFAADALARAELGLPRPAGQVALEQARTLREASPVPQFKSKQRSL